MTALDDRHHEYEDLTPGLVPRHIEVLTARQTTQLPDPPIEDMLLGPTVVRRYRTILAGGTGQGKTSLSLAMVKAICNGTELLGWHGQGECRALIIDLEQGLRTIKRRLREAQIDQSDNIHIARIPDGLALDSELADMIGLQDTLAAGQYDVVLIDPYYKLHRADANDERGTVDLMRMLDRWRDNYGFALILPAHNRKMQIAGVKPTIDDVFGSGSLSRGAEIVLGVQLVKQGYSRLHFFKDRDGDLPVGGEPWGLLFDQTHGYRRDPNDEAAPRDYKQEIREIKNPHEWRTLKEIRTLIGAGQDPTRDALDTLVAAGEYQYEVGPTGRHVSSHCWRKTGDLAPPGHPRSPRSPQIPGIEGVAGDLDAHPPLGGEHNSGHLPDAPTAPDLTPDNGQVTHHERPPLEDEPELPEPPPNDIDTLTPTSEGWDA